MEFCPYSVSYLEKVFHKFKIFPHCLQKFSTECGKIKETSLNQNFLENIPV